MKVMAEDDAQKTVEERDKSMEEQKDEHLDDEEQDSEERSDEESDDDDNASNITDADNVPVKETTTSPNGLSLSDDTLRKAIAALFESASRRIRQQATKSQSGENGKADEGEAVPLLEDPSGQDLAFFLQFTFKVPPQRNFLRPISMEGEDDVLFIVKDPQRLVKDYLQRKGDGGVTRVLGVSKLRKRYGTHEGKRELLRQFDHFLVDRRVAPMLPRLLGKSFIDSKRIPRSVNMKRDVVANIKRALRSTSFTPRRGTSTTVRVGHGDLTPQQIFENCHCVLPAVLNSMGGWKNIQAVHLKTTKSPALPLYFALPDVSPFASEKAHSPASKNVTKSNEVAVVSGEEDVESDGGESN